MIDGNVHIDRRGRGLGSYILRWMEGQAREEFDEIDQGTHLVIRTSCADHLTDRIRLFEQYGFKAVRYAIKFDAIYTSPSLKNNYRKACASCSGRNLLTTP